MLEIVMSKDSDYDYVVVGTPNTEDPMAGAIEKWLLIAAFLFAVPGCTIDDGQSETCSFCQTSCLNCRDCPIMLYTGFRGCCNTPYAQWHIFGDLASAQAELDFLYEVKEGK